MAGLSSSYIDFDFSPWSSQIGLQSEVYELLKAVFLLGNPVTTVTYMGTFGPSTGRSPHTFGQFQHAKRNMLHQPIVL